MKKFSWDSSLIATSNTQNQIIHRILPQFHAANDTRDTAAPAPCCNPAILDTILFMNNHHWIFLSPHLDDVTLSCGALVWDLVRQGHRVEIWTLMAGLPPDEDFSPFAQQLHETWGISGTEAILARRAEDRAACAILGAELRHFDWPDAIYRRDTLTGEPMVNNDDQLFSRAPEPTLVNEIVEMISSSLPEGAHLVFPIGLGGHIDHQAVVRAGAAIAREKILLCGLSLHR
jgi:LmbE family N-acetylglucosaminyl deacetylase